MSERFFQALRKVAVFRAASDEDLRRLAEIGIERQVEEGGFFFLQGDPAGYLYVMLRGRAKLCQITPDGQQVNLRTLVPGQVFGAIGAVDDPQTAEAFGLPQGGAVYPACAQALEDSSAVAIESGRFRQLLGESPGLSFGLMRLMTGYIQEMQSRFTGLATQRVEQRIAGALLRLAAQGGQKSAQGIELSFSRQDLAEMTGTTLYTVSRVLSGWEKRGLIAAGRERVTLLIPHGLVRIAEDLDE